MWRGEQLTVRLVVFSVEGLGPLRSRRHAAGAMPSILLPPGSISRGGRRLGAQVQQRAREGADGGLFPFVEELWREVHAVAGLKPFPRVVRRLVVVVAVGGAAVLLPLF